MVNLREIEEGSSSTSHDHDNNNDKRYDVFISFRGLDTRNNFTDHLYNALIQDNIKTFLDDEEIETGEDLKPELEDAIRSSRASVIVLSENYATSTWCLDELVLILERRLTSDHIVIPIFYHVEPTDVRKQQKSFGDAMAEHRRKKMEAETNAEKSVRWDEKIDGWINALKAVADLKGKDVKGRKETDFIEEIITEIFQRLRVPVAVSDTLPLLIGRNHQIEEITSWLTDGSSSHTVDILTVVGMGGIGKTSLAKHVFRLHSRAFDKSSFIEGINLRCTGNYNGLFNVQRQLYGDISKRNKLPIHDTWLDTSKIETALAGVKVFLVLDDVASLGQLDALLGNKGIHPGSKIIITTKDASLTERCALFKSKVNPKHTKLLLEVLSGNESLDLLCFNAFCCNNPKEGYEEVSKKVSEYCEGHPLALEVLGKALYNRDVDEWEGYIEKLKKETDPSIKKVLQMSFDSLSFDNDKDLFKHIACFFVGEDRDYTETILKACKIETRSGIRNLVDRCLLSIGWKNKLMMHQLLQEMGRDEVRKESPNKPWKRSRVWSHEESCQVLKQKKHMENILGLTLDTRVLEKEKLRGPVEVKTDVLRKMDNIMLLQLNYVQIKGTYKNFPEELRWLCMHGFPLKSIPSDLSLDNLVALDMSYSNIESFGMCRSSGVSRILNQVIGWCSKDKRVRLPSLKILDLSFCEQLHKLGGFYELPTLERLIVRNCVRLIEISESLEECVELVHIDLSYCVKLEKLPTAMHKLKKVETLLLDGCHISSLVEKIPIGLNLCVIPLPSSLVRLSLADSNLSNESFPMDFSCLPSLKYLCLDRNPIVSMPDCVRSLCRLEELSMFGCKTLMSVEDPPCTLRRLDIRPSSGVGDNMQPLLQRISFHPDMSPVTIQASVNSLRPWSFEMEGMVKIQPLEGVEETVLSSLCWTNILDSLDKRQVVTTYNDWREPEPHTIQMYYEFGIFSTIYGGQPILDCNWYSWSISNPGFPRIKYKIPSSPNKLKSLGVCCVQRRCPTNALFELPTIEIHNKTKNRTWIYTHCIGAIDVDGEWLTYLSHWMHIFNEMETDDDIIITLKGTQFEQCGMRLVNEDGRMEEYYKSWNHIIGGDLSAFQFEFNGEYHLSHPSFTRNIDHGTFVDLGTSGSLGYKEATVPFRAFSKMKSTETIRILKGNMVGIGDHQPPSSVQGVPLSQTHSLQGASTSKRHICDDDDDDDDTDPVYSRKKQKK